MIRTCCPCALSHREPGSCSASPHDPRRLAASRPLAVGTTDEIPRVLRQIVGGGKAAAAVVIKTTATITATASLRTVASHSTGETGCDIATDRFVVVGR